MKRDCNYTKSTLLVLSLLLLTAYAYGQNAPQIEAINSPWDFGRVKQGLIIEKHFFIANRGESPLVIESVSSCCGYRIVNLSLWTIAPGEKSKITISCSSRLKNPGEDKKYFTIKSNDPANPELKVPIISYIIENPLFEGKEQGICE